MIDCPESKALLFFKEAFRQDRLAHAYLLTGTDVAHQYQLVMALAQLLNCETLQTNGGTAQQAETKACGICRSCKWIAAAAHPAIQVVSRLTFFQGNSNTKFDDEGPELGAKTAKKEATQISVDQTRYLVDMLGRRVSDRESRVLIFVDATVQDLVGETSEDNVFPVPYEWRSQPAHQGKTLNWKPLTPSVFSESSVAALLKYIEEPNPRTYFFFLGQTPRSVLETIASRCQHVHVPNQSTPANKPDHVGSVTPELEAWIRDLQQLPDAMNAQIYAERLARALETLDSKPLNALEQFSSLLKQHRERLFDQQPETYLRWQRQILKAQRQLKASCQPASCLWNLCKDLLT
jgi:hypothetical protein